MERGPKRIDTKLSAALGDVHVPSRFAIDGPLRDEVLPGLRSDFDSYFLRQRKRIKTQGTTEYMGPQEAFEEELSFLVQVVDRVDKTVAAHPGGPTIVLFDVDETFGRVPDSNNGGIDGLLDADMADEGTRKKGLADSYKQLQIRPAFIHAVNHLKKEHDRHVQFGILTTKAQEGLDTHLAPMLDKLCPGAFEPELLMSSKDGAVERIIPDVIDKQNEARNQRKRLSVRDAIEGFLETSPKERAIVAERVLNTTELDGSISSYDLKWFMMIRILEELRQEAHTKMQEGLPMQENQDEWHDAIHLNPAVILFDDAEQELPLPHDSSVQYVAIRRYRLPDDQSQAQMEKEREAEMARLYG